MISEPYLSVAFDPLWCHPAPVGACDLQTERNIYSAEALPIASEWILLPSSSGNSDLAVHRNPPLLLLLLLVSDSVASLTLRWLIPLSSCFGPTITYVMWLDVHFRPRSPDGKALILHDCQKLITSICEAQRCLCALFLKRELFFVPPCIFYSKLRYYMTLA